MTSYITTPIAYNPDSLVGDTLQIGQLAIGTNPSIDYSQNYGGLQWWMTPDQTNNYIIAIPVGGGNEPVPVGVTPTSAYVGFYQSTDLTDESFLNLVNWVSGGSYGSSIGDALTWLNNVGLWTSYNNSNSSTWYIVTGGEGYAPAWYSGTIMFPDTQGGNSVGLSDLSQVLSQGSIYINQHDTLNNDQTPLLTSLIGNSGTITFTQGANTITFSFQNDSFAGANFGDNVVYWDAGNGSSADVTVISSNNPVFTDGAVSVTISIGVPTFRITADDVSNGYNNYNTWNGHQYPSAVFGTNGNEGYEMILYSGDPINSTYATYVPYVISMVNPYIANFFTSLANSGILSPYETTLWDVTWGPGSTHINGVVSMSGVNNVGDSMYLAMLDTSDPNWDALGSNNETVLAGSYYFPATFKLREPVINKGGWC